jgi:hypothetical protein
LCPAKFIIGGVSASYDKVCTDGRDVFVQLPSWVCLMFHAPVVVAQQAMAIMTVE